MPVKLSSASLLSRQLSVSLSLFSSSRVLRSMKMDSEAVVSHGISVQRRAMRASAAAIT